MKKGNTKIFLTIILLFILLLAFLYLSQKNNSITNKDENNKTCVLYKATSQNYTYQNLDSKKHVAKFKIMQNKDNLNIQFYPTFIITQPGEIKNYWLEATTNKKINESEITYLIEVNGYPLQTIKTKLQFECAKYESKNNTNNNTTNQTQNQNNNTNNTNNMFYKIIIGTIIVVLIIILLLYFLIKAGRKEVEKSKKQKEKRTIKKTEEKEKKEKKESKKAKLEKLLERVEVKKGLTTFQKIIIFLFIILIIILAIIAIQNSSFDLTTFTAPITNISNITK